MTKITLILGVDNTSATLHIIQVHILYHMTSTHKSKFA